MVYMIWFTSDYHLNHFNIIRYCNRPFKTSKEMDERIISNHNEIVAPNDEVYFLGDFQFGGDHERYYPRMNGVFTFIQGNHDRSRPFRSRQGFILKNINGFKVLMCHWPKYVRDFDDLKKQADILVCGHIHEKGRFIIWNGYDLLINVGVDVWEFKPVTFNEIIKIYPKRENRESWILEMRSKSPKEIFENSSSYDKLEKDNESI